MTTEPQIAVEPVTDEDVLVAVKVGEMVVAPFVQQALEQDRRRVAERVAGRTAEMAEWVGIAAEIERLRAEVAAHRKHDVLRCDALMKAEAEVAKLNAACAAKDEALRLLTDMDELRETDELYIARAALSDTAGANMIDATGAVETGVFWYSGRYVVEIPKSMALSRVLIVRKPK